MLRMNFQHEPARWVETNIDNWVVLPDPSVDLAFCMTPWTQPFDHQLLRLSTALDNDGINKYSIGIGDEVFLIGLFTQHHGSRRNIPLLRVGNIAAMPEEPIQSNGALMDAFLIEARSIGGLSGSPVFVHLGVTRHVGEELSVFSKPSFFLLGVMHGHWDSPDYDIEPADDIALPRKQTVNMGIAIVVPAQKIIEFFNQESVLEFVETARREWVARNSSVLGVPRVDAFDQGGAD
jgi:hypothetical protein